jgi:hypothetical protein
MLAVQEETGSFQKKESFEGHTIACMPEESWLYRIKFAVKRPVESCQTSSAAVRQNRNKKKLSRLEESWQARKKAFSPE